MAEVQSGRVNASRVVRHQQLDVYKRAFASSMQLFVVSGSFPRDEIYALVSQLRRSSRSVAANLAEAWRKRRYEAAFIAKLSDAEGEAAETQTWIEYAVKCGYLDRATGAALYREYDGIIRTLVGMITHAEDWLLPSPRPSRMRRTSSAGLRYP